MTVCAADGMLVNVADMLANREKFGCTGTAAQEGEGAAPFPQVRIVALTARAGRAMLGAICGRARAGEQTLLARMLRRRPELFVGRVICFDCNFPGHELISAICTSGHVVARVKDEHQPPVRTPGRGWLSDGSRIDLAERSVREERRPLAVRAAEHSAVLPCGDEKMLRPAP